LYTHRGEAVTVDVAIELEARDSPPDEIALPDDDTTQQCRGIKHIDPEIGRDEALTVDLPSSTP
jgi:hypothetical protein